MREVICTHIGQAGVQLSSTIWETFCTEHGIQADGILKNSDDSEDTSFRTFFQEVPSGQFVPRVISVDLEPNVLDEIRSGPYRKLFHPDQLVSGFEDAANNYARGHFTLGKNYIDYAVSRIRKVVEMCENLEGFFIFNSYGGGTGSGFSALMLERLSVEFTKKTRFQNAVAAGEKLATSTVEPYNSLLCSASLIDNTDICNIFDNESLYNICCSNLEIPRPTFANVNRVVSQVVSSLTVSIRFSGVLNSELSQMITNLVPYPRIHFPVFAHTPILSARKANHQTMTTGELTRAAFESSNQLVSCNLNEGRYMCCCLQYRGKVTPKEVNESLYEIKKREDIKFVEWCPTSFKLGLNAQPPAFIPRSEMAETNKSLTMLSNSTAIAQKFRRLTEKFDILFAKRSFVHWYVGEGMEEAEFANAHEEMSMLYFDYEELNSNEIQAEDDSGIPRESMKKSVKINEEATNVENEEENEVENEVENEDNNSESENDGKPSVKEGAEDDD